MAAQGAVDSVGLGFYDVDHVNAKVAHVLATKPFDPLEPTAIKR